MRREARRALGPAGDGRKAAPTLGPRAAAERSAELQELPRPLVAMAALYPDAAQSTRHAHRRGQFVLGKTGATAMATEHGVFVIPADHGFWIPPGTLHQSRSWADVDVQSVYIDPDTATDFPRRCRLVKTSPLLRALMDEIVLLPPMYDRNGRDEQLIQLLLCEIGRMEEASWHVPLPSDARLRRICEAVLAGTGRHASLAEWAEIGGLTRRTFTRAFRRETGTSFVSWQQKVRLFEAVARLRQGEAVTSVALQVGYGNPSAFAALFKRELGASPYRYVTASLASG